MNMTKLKTEVVANVIAAFIISFIFLIISDFVFSPPNLNGKWEMVLKVKDSNYSSYKGLLLKYDVFLIQNGNHVTGTAEKIGEFDKGIFKKYSVPIRSEIQGTITNKYFQKDVLNIHFLEFGERRTITSYFELTRFNDEYMAGEFSSSAANSIGDSEWLRSISDINEVMFNLN